MMRHAVSACTFLIPVSQVSWKLVQKYNTTKYSTMTPVSERTFRDSSQIACPLNTPCKYVGPLCLSFKRPGQSLSLWRAPLTQTHAERRCKR